MYVICWVYLNIGLARNLVTTVLRCDMMGSAYRRWSLLPLCIGICCD